MLNEINKKLLEARKTKDELTKSVLTLLKADFINNEKSHNKLEDINLLRGFIKRLEKSADAYRKADVDTYNNILKEIEVAKELLPQLPTEDEIKAVVQETIGSYALEHGNAPHMGVVMKAVKEKLPLADGKLTSTIVREALA